jgi:hypothetical protein
MTYACGRLESILIARAAGDPMIELESADLSAGVGIHGDRYAEGRGYWSDPRWPDQEVTLVEAEVADALGLRPEQLRRNFVTREVRLNDLIGREFAIGTVRFYGVRPCDPCLYIEGSTRPGMSGLLAGRGGLRVRILEGGQVRKGDEILLADSHANTR